MSQQDVAIAERAHDEGQWFKAGLCVNLASPIAGRDEFRSESAVPNGPAGRSSGERTRRWPTWRTIWGSVSRRPDRLSFLDEQAWVRPREVADVRQIVQPDAGHLNVAHRADADRADPGG